MKRAATQLFKRQSKNRAFSKLSNFYFDLRPPGQDRGAKTRPQGQLECANPRRLPRGRGWSGLELTDTLISHPFRGVLGLIPFPKAAK